MLFRSTAAGVKPPKSQAPPRSTGARRRRRISSPPPLCVSLALIFSSCSNLILLYACRPMSSQVAGPEIWSASPDLSSAPLPAASGSASLLAVSPRQAHRPVRVAHSQSPCARAPSGEDEPLAPEPATSPIGPAASRPAPPPPPLPVARLPDPARPRPPWFPPCLVPSHRGRAAVAGQRQHQPASSAYGAMLVV